MPSHGNKVNIAGCKMTVVNMTDDSTTVCSQPCVLLGIHVNTALSAHVCTIDDGTTSKIILDASLAAGSYPNFHSAIFDTSLIVNPHNDASAGQIVVFWREL